jgi:hypothetical protein
MRCSYTATERDGEREGERKREAHLYLSATPLRRAYKQKLTFTSPQLLHAAHTNKACTTNIDRQTELARVGLIRPST